MILSNFLLLAPFILALPSFVKASHNGNASNQEPQDLEFMNDHFPLLGEIVNSGAIPTKLDLLRLLYTSWLRRDKYIFDSTIDSCLYDFNQLSMEEGGMKKTLVSMLGDKEGEAFILELIKGDRCSKMNFVPALNEVLEAPIFRYYATDTWDNPNYSVSVDLVNAIKKDCSATYQDVVQLDHNIQNHIGFINNTPTPIVLGDFIIENNEEGEINNDGATDEKANLLNKLRKAGAVIQEWKEDFEQWTPALVETRVEVKGLNVFHYVTAKGDEQGPVACFSHTPNEAYFPKGLWAKLDDRQLSVGHRLGQSDNYQHVLDLVVNHEKGEVSIVEKTPSSTSTSPKAFPSSLGAWIAERDEDGAISELYNTLWDLKGEGKTFQISKDKDLLVLMGLRRPTGCRLAQLAGQSLLYSDRADMAKMTFNIFNQCHLQDSINLLVSAVIFYQEKVQQK